MTREEIKDFCDMRAQLEPENEDIYKAIIKILEREPCCNCIQFKRYSKEMGFEIEEEPKSEWQKDHEILKAYSDGANEVLDKLKAKIVERRHLYQLNKVSINHLGAAEEQALTWVLETIDNLLSERGT